MATATQHWKTDIKSFIHKTGIKALQFRFLKAVWSKLMLSVQSNLWYLIIYSAGYFPGLGGMWKVSREIIKPASFRLKVQDQVAPSLFRETDTAQCLPVGDWTRFPQSWTQAQTPNCWSSSVHALPDKLKSTDTCLRCRGQLELWITRFKERSWAKWKGGGGAELQEDDVSQPNNEVWRW